MNIDQLILTQYKSLLYCYGLDKRVRPALLIVEDLKSAWGQWCSRDRVIRLARRLLSSYEWDVVLNVLKHEVAHQLVDELLTPAGMQPERPHGPLFQKACDILGVPLWARGPSIDMESDSVLNDWKTRKKFETDHPAFKRIQKLLSLAESSNQFEAELAAQRASELHRKYLLESGSVNGVEGSPPRCDAENSAQEFDTLFFSHHTLKFDAVKTALHSLLVSHYGVDCVYTDMYSESRGMMVKAVAVMGRRKNLVMAEYAYEFLVRSIESLWLEKKRSGMRASFKRSYQLGVVRGFRECLEKLNISQDGSSPESFNRGASGMSGTGQALAKTNQLAEERVNLRNYKRSQFPSVRTSSSSRAGVYGDAYKAGQSDGSNLKMRTPIKQGGGSQVRPLLLG